MCSVICCSYWTDKTNSSTCLFVVQSNVIDFSTRKLFDPMYYIAIEYTPLGVPFILLAMASKGVYCYAKEGLHKHQTPLLPFHQILGSTLHTFLLGPIKYTLYCLPKNGINIICIPVFLLIALDYSVRFPYWLIAVKCFKCSLEKSNFVFCASQVYAWENSNLFTILKARESVHSTMNIMLACRYKRWSKTAVTT